MTQSTGQVAYHSGVAAERIVALDYERRGLRIVQRRWRGPGGEIDLIARNRSALVFVEVKKARTFAQAAERLSARQMQRIQLSALDYLGAEPSGQLTELRFDVALVDQKGQVEIIENAFGQI